MKISDWFCKKATAISSDDWGRLMRENNEDEFLICSGLVLVDWREWMNDKQLKEFFESR